jgi:hypothetical protein
MFGSPALAIAWMVWARHRTALILAATLLAALAIALPLLAARIPGPVVAVTGSVTLIGIIGLVLNSLLFVEKDGSLSSRYPRHMLTLPVSSLALAFWPMLLATSGAALLWVASAVFYAGSTGGQFPVLVPALGLAALMAWAQALAWLPIAVPIARELVNLAVMAALGALPVGLTIASRGETGLLLPLLGGYIACAYAVGYAAVNADRRGHSWRLWPAAVSRQLSPATASAHRRRPFRSPFAAQVWYEWNCHGMMLNGFVAASLFLIWAILIVNASRNSSPEWFGMIIVLLAIVVLAFIAASSPSFGQFRPIWNQTQGFVEGNSFLSTRPMSTAHLIAAKFRMAAASVLCTWALAGVGTVFWIVVTGNLENARIVIGEFFHRYPGSAGVAILALACVLLPALSWKLLTGSVAPLVTGRRWVANGAAYAYLSLFISLVCGASWFTSHPEDRPALYTAIPLLVLGIATIKGAAATVTFRAALHKRLMSWRSILGVLSLWTLLTSCGVAMVILTDPPVGMPLSWPIVTLGVASSVPLLRFPLATLALDWNRHR